MVVLRAEHFGGEEPQQEGRARSKCAGLGKAVPSCSLGWLERAEQCWADAQQGWIRALPLLSLGAEGVPPTVIFGAGVSTDPTVARLKGHGTARPAWCRARLCTQTQQQQLWCCWSASSLQEHCQL